MRREARRVKFKSYLHKTNICQREFVDTGVKCEHLNIKCKQNPLRFRQTTFAMNFLAFFLARMKNEWKRESNFFRSFGKCRWYTFQLSLSITRWGQDRVKFYWVIVFSLCGKVQFNGRRPVAIEIWVEILTIDLYYKKKAGYFQLNCN